MVKLMPDAEGSLRPMYRYQQDNAANAERNGQSHEMVPLRSDEDQAGSEGNDGQANSNGQSRFGCVTCRLINVNV